MKAKMLLFRILRFYFRTLGRWSSSLGGRAALRLFCTPFQAKLSTPAKAFLATTVRRRLTLAGLGIETFSRGEGPVVLLVHGWNSHGASLRAFAAPLLENGYRVVVVNLPAHGGSDNKTTNMLETSRVLADLIRSEAPVKGVIAHSFGGPATLLALRNQPQLPVERVATIGSPIDMDKVFSDFSKRFKLSPAADKNMRERVDRIFGEPFLDLDLPAVAATLGDRLLVVHDTEDVDVPVREARTMAAGPGVQQMITQGFGHNRILRREPVVQRIVQHMTA